MSLRPNWCLLYTQAVCKQSDLTERTVQRWFRRRRNQDRPTTMTKFTETTWAHRHTAYIALWLESLCCLVWCDWLGCPVSPYIRYSVTFRFNYSFWPPQVADCMVNYGMLDFVFFFCYQFSSQFCALCAQGPTLLCIVRLHLTSRLLSVCDTVWRELSAFLNMSIDFQLLVMSI